MAKDPAVLLYIDKWIASTNGMRAEFRAWYLDLLLHNYDKGSVPNDLDEIAGICRVRPSEYHVFNQMVDQVLNQKFNQSENGSWFNELTNEILRKREAFVDKRTKSSNIGVVVKAARRMKCFTEANLTLLKEHLYTLPVEEIEKFKNNHMVASLVNHLVNLYIDVDVNKDINTGKEGGMGEETPADDVGQFFIVREFNQIWLETMKDYLPDDSKDFPALHSIAVILCKTHRLLEDGQPREYYEPVLEKWRKMVAHIAEDKLFSKFNLKQIYEYIQSIGQSMANAEKNKSSSPVKQSTIQTNLEEARRAKQLLDQIVNQDATDS